MAESSAVRIVATWRPARITGRKLLSPMRRKGGFSVTFRGGRLMPDGPRMKSHTAAKLAAP
ncbi:MAG: hypothetical protein LC634_04745, partial [Sphingomonadales bacterium]|nr:hypothetical protein [Sphingomonadales bacterium]